MTNTILKSTLALLAISSVAFAEEAKGPDYNQQIVPVFRKYCLGCHDDTLAEGGLVMQSYQSLMKGGKHGAAIVPGSSQRSRLYRMLTGQAKPKMPPEDNEAPKEEEIALIKAWIDAGAKGPSGDAPPPGLIVPSIKPRSEVPASIHAVEFAPDGKLVAIAKYQTVQLVDPQSGVILRKLAGHTGNVTSVSFSKDGKWLATASGEPGLFGEAKLWDVKTGKEMKSVRGHDDSLYAAELSPDGKTLATAGYDKIILLWNVNSGKQTNLLKGHNGAVFDLSFSPDGTKLASASADATVKMWDVQSGKRLETFGQSLEGVNTLAFSPDGKRLAAGGVDNRVRVYRISDSGREGTNPILYARFAHQGAIINLAFTRDGKRLASSADDRTVKLWNFAKMEELHQLETQSDWPTALDFTPEGKSLLVGRYDGTLAFYNAQSGKKERALDPKPPAPELSGIWPRGVELDGKARLKLSGKHLEDAQKLVLNHNKLTGKLLPKAQANELWIEVAADKSLSPGSYEVAVVTPGGKSKAVKLHVENLPQQEEAEPNNNSTEAQELALPTSAWGVLRSAGDADHYRFTAKKSEQIVLDLQAESLGSKANLMLTVMADDGRVLESRNDFAGENDPLLVFDVPANGNYVVQVRDMAVQGSPDHYYRLSAGKLPLVTAIYPLSVPPKQETEIRLIGVNLPKQATATVKAGSGGELTVPLDARQLRFRKPFKVAVGKWPEQLENEPNDTPEKATAIQAPGTVGGQIHAAGADSDADLFRFTSRKNQEWVIETDAARRGSPVDTKVEVLDGQGQPIKRLQLQATRDSYIAFRPIGSTQRNCRVKFWEEMELNQYLYMSGEVVKLYRMPQGPDSGFLFYGRGGTRLCYFDTSPTTHALGEPCYIVEPHPPQAELVPTGLPVFPIYFSNDDSSDRKLGRDSRLYFTAPADGEYLVRVTDSRAHASPRHAYRLTVRPRQPDFSVRLQGANPTVAAGSGKSLKLVADRVDGFDGPIQVHIEGLPPGFSVTSPVVIQAGHLEAETVIHAEPNAPQPTKENAAQTKVTATAEIAGKAVSKSVNDLGRIKLSGKPKLIVTLEPAEVTLAPGETVTARLKVERNGFKDRIRFDVENLPHGVIVDNIGLSGILIPPGESEREIFLNARNWVPETDRPFFATARAAGDQSSVPILLKVRQKSPLAEAQKEDPQAGSAAAGQK